MTMQRSRLEWLLMGSLALALLSFPFIIFKGTAYPSYPWPLAVLMGWLPLALALFALLKMYRGRRSGLWLCLTFYALQILAYHDRQGRLFGFTCGLSVSFRLNEDQSAPLELSLTALALTICSALAIRNRARPIMAAEQISDA
jgi:hypothetical protein